MLTERGLALALNALAARAPVPVTLDTDDRQRLPAPVEVAAYFVVAEALANVAKYAQATQASVTVRRDNGAVSCVDISDDGIGGADAALGSGLRGLGDRVAALDGTLSLESPAGPRHTAARQDPLRPGRRVGVDAARQATPRPAGRSQRRLWGAERRSSPLRRG